MNPKPIVLKVLLQHRHLQTHRAFCREYDRVAATVDPTQRSGWPSKAQFYRWLSGDLVGLPYTDHCRILEGMFPNWKVDQLFHAHDEGIDFIPEPTTPQTQKPTRPVPSTGPTDQLKEAGISHLWPHTNPAVLDDLVERVNNASEEITGRFQSVMATQCSAISSLKTSIGFFQFSVLRGLPFSSAATLS
ncbi:MAG: hypothetical protein WCF33_05210, partial [Pseudonocardiaceae bacterium]